MTGVMLGQGVVLVLLLTVHGHVHPIGGRGCHGWGALWLLVLPEGSTCPSGEAEVREGVERFDDVMGARARQKLPHEAPMSPETFPHGSGGVEVDFRASSG
jgi:hypothetical protein